MRFWLALLFLALAAMPAQAAWLEASTNHFVIYSDAKPDELRAFATRLEKFDKALRWLRNMPDRDGGASNRMIVYVVPNAEAIRRLCGRRRGGGCANVAGFYVARAGGSIAYTPRRVGGGSKFDIDSETVLFHEYTHHFMYQNFAGAYPVWFSEGFAEFNSTASIGKDGKVGIGLVANHRLYGLVSRKPLTVPAMLGIADEALRGDKREAVYGRGWLLTHYLTFEPTRKGQLTNYILKINDGVPALKAAEAAFGDLKQLDRELDAYLKRKELAYWEIPADKLPIGPIAIRALGAGEAATMPVRLRSDRGVDATEAAAVVIEARRLAAPFPKDAPAQGVLAEAEFDVGDDAAADAAADRALASDPSSPQALIYKGMVAVRRASAAKTQDAAAWKLARSWFLKANRLDPDRAEPLMLFYLSFSEAGQAPTRNAVAGLMRAFELAPEDQGLRWTVARQQLMDGSAANARKTLAALAFDPHVSSANNRAAALIALIDKGEKPEAVMAAGNMQALGDATDD